jgi:hypothetical protein
MNILCGFAVLLIGAGLLNPSQVRADEATICDAVEDLARFPAPCGCPSNDCECLYISQGTAEVTCSSPCIYCAFGACVFITKGAARGDERDAGLGILTLVSITATYTYGRTGSLSITQDTAFGTKLTANDIPCTSCSMVSCADGSEKLACDCANIEANAIFNFCEPGGGLSTDSFFIGLFLDVMASCDVQGENNGRLVYGSPEAQPTSGSRGSSDADNTQGGTTADDTGSSSGDIGAGDGGVESDGNDAGGSSGNIGTGDGGVESDATDTGGSSGSTGVNTGGVGAQENSGAGTTTCTSVTSIKYWAVWSVVASALV